MDVGDKFPNEESAMKILLGSKVGPIVGFSD